MIDDQKYMQLAFDLAKKGAGRVSPNPLVGCVVVKKNKIIAKGFHKKFGAAHAEIEALRKIKFKGKGCTLYVNLEPCFHFGKTPPCVDTLIKSNLKRVVIAMKDPNPKTNGKSIQKLKAAGIDVAVGVCQNEAQELNRFFIKSVKSHLPYVIIKVAQSLDGKISTQKGTQGWITGDLSHKYVQSLRTQIDAILVGCGTVAIDNPRLNVRNAKKHQPKRVILDPHLKTNLTSKIFSVHGGELIFVSSLNENHPRVKAVRAKGGKVLCIAQKKGKSLNLRVVLSHLQGIGISSVLVEGGAKVFHSFVESKLVDEWQFVIAPKIIGSKGLMGIDVNQQKDFVVQSISQLGSDLLVIAKAN